MRAFIEAQGIEIWQSIENGYKVPKTVPTDADELAQYDNNSKARNHLLSAIDESVFNKVMNYPSAKEMWDKLQTTVMKEITKSKKPNFKLTGDNLNS